MNTNYTIGPALALVLPVPINNVSPNLVHYIYRIYAICMLVDEVLNKKYKIKLDYIIISSLVACIHTQIN